MPGWFLDRMTSLRLGRHPVKGWNMVGIVPCEGERILRLDCILIRESPSDWEMSCDGISD